MVNGRLYCIECDKQDVGGKSMERRRQVIESAVESRLCGGVYGPRRSDGLMERVEQLPPSAGVSSPRQLEEPPASPVS